jgi:hypothetical protein
MKNIAPVMAGVDARGWVTLSRRSPKRAPSGAWPVDPLGQIRIASEHAALEVDRAADGVDGTGELDEQAIAVV